MFHLVSLLPFLASAQAYFILTQPILLTTRLDPIVDPGGVSGHVHSIAGGSNFDKTMSYESTQESVCTTAPVTVDKSNYWIPQLYYYNPETTGFQAIPAAYVNTYYLNRGGSNDTVTAFPDGLRMVSGDPFRREFDANDIDSQAISFVCLDYAGGHQGDPAWDQRNSFFEHNCPDGLRAQVNFRTCWNCVDLDSDDHRSHMAWPVNGNNNGGGDCPASHPVKTVALFYEFIFEVQKFPFNAPGTPTWVFANGDTTGYGLHADFVNGWPSLINGTNVLQRAIDECDDNLGVGGVLTDCPPFLEYINNAQAESCRPETLQVNEEIGFNREIAFLPGDNPLWIGNGSKPTRDNFTEGETEYTDFKSVLPANWAYVGCVAEAVNGRALEAYTFSAPNMTRAVCAAACGARGFALSGTQYAQECYCDSQMRNAASNTTLLDAGKCELRCLGNPNENCGGYRTLDLFVNPTLFTEVISGPNPDVAAEVTGWYKKERNCVKEPAGKRALTGFVTSSPQMTPSMCMSLCQARGFAFAGTEYSGECYCGASVDAGATEVPSSECNMACSGKPDESCGGPARLNLYFSNSTTTPSTPSAPNNTNVQVEGWVDRGCYTEGSGGRALPAYTFSRQDMSIPTCLTECGLRGFAFGGVEYGRECYCSGSISNGARAVTDGSCNMVCPGDRSTLCGGPNRLNVFETTVPPPSTPAVWNYRGCYTETTADRAVQGGYLASGDMNSEVCQAFARENRHSWAALVYGRECFTGYSLSPDSEITAESECSMTCVGSEDGEKCGGSGRASVFELGGEAGAARVAPSSSTSAESKTTSTAVISSSTSTPSFTSPVESISSASSTSSSTTSSSTTSSSSTSSSSTSDLTTASPAESVVSSSTSSAPAASSSESSTSSSASSPTLPASSSEQSSAASGSPTTLRKRSLTGRRLGRVIKV